MVHSHYNFWIQSPSDINSLVFEKLTYDKIIEFHPHNTDFFWSVIQ